MTRSARDLTPKQQHWLSHIVSCRESGQSVREYARRHRLSSPQLDTWTSRLRALGALDRSTGSAQRLLPLAFVKLRDSGGDGAQLPPCEPVSRLDSTREHVPLLGRPVEPWRPPQLPPPVAGSKSSTQRMTGRSDARLWRPSSQHGLRPL